MRTVQVQGGTMFERDIADKTVLWCIKRLGLGKLRTLHICVDIKRLHDCAGYCEDTHTPRLFMIAVATNQSLRDFVMTVIHEMVHVRQYVRNKWVGDGEEEAWSLQEQLVDEIWKEDVL